MQGVAMRGWVVSAVLAAIFMTSGCLAMAVGYTGYAISKSRGEAADKEATARIMDSYSRYQTEMARTNMERERAGLKPQPVLSFIEWQAAAVQTPAPPVGAPAEGKEKQGAILE